ncbi:hypothetical protein [Helicobacter sp. MIT 01-3238]|uniref:hypothetical protein n=1 Tax=Helicobacter sp. MIT 01-3238 TaxID=398627 RepID=UPI0011C056EA|nr:hypothetical protein [Helicobacter sp. MIT 01-3238]
MPLLLRIFSVSLALFPALSIFALFPAYFQHFRVFSRVFVGFIKPLPAFFSVFHAFKYFTRFLRHTPYFLCSSFI